ncbi:class C sortase, partial [Pseudoflavonifractor capillosus]|uniref:class C sortase n=1 Tax=Pseudoflavonifractor capillosus TaxID=106588 RepID=UPI00195D7D3B
MARWLLGLALAVDLALMVILCKPIAAPMVYEQTVKEEVAVVGQEQKEPGIHQDLREAMEAYNLQLSQDQSGLDSVDSYEAPGLNLKDYGLGTDDPVGYIEIPAMDVTLPLYLGASRAHMNDGAAVLGQTSMPIGGISTNCVIAAHRGWNGKAMFRDVELLQEGDLVYLTNLWETLTYQVTGISIIWPDEVEAVAIKPEQDMVTLLTCHPYIVGTHRYLVYCQRVEQDTPVQEPTVTAPNIQQTQFSVKASQSEIELESHLQLVALGLSICTAVVLIYTMAT